MLSSHENGGVSQELRLGSIIVNFKGFTPSEPLQSILQIDDELFPLLVMQGLTLINNNTLRK